MAINKMDLKKTKVGILFPRLKEKVPLLISNNVLQNEFYPKFGDFRKAP